MSEGVRQRVNGPAIGLIVTGAVGLLLEAPSHMAYLLLNGAQQLEKLRRELGAELPAGLYYASNATFLLLILAASGFLIFAGLRMRQLRSWVPCVVACFVSIVPCSTCCCMGIPIGIWGLIVLMKDDVKQAFTS